MPDTSLHNSYFHADKHVSAEPQDEFDRYPFASKLAGLIAKHYSSHGLVIGVYGQWGEGKSSFLDFVHAATDLLSKQEPELYKTIIIKFNPWRFSDEDQLLMSFFAELRAALDSEVDIDTTTLNDSIWHYTRILLARKSVFGELSAEQTDKFKEFGSLEVLKSNINKALSSSGRKLLILIDDSDRLSNQEVATTLRLVKLTADFSNTTYLIGLNQAMVANAIGSHYPGERTKAGFEFLEKIIQVPLHLPPIQNTRIQAFFQRRIDEVLYRTGQVTRLSEQDTNRYKDALYNSILPVVPNPRSIYRFANVLLIAIPLLEDEANVTDILLIEALRIFYPLVYELVKNNEEAFTGPSDVVDRNRERQLLEKLWGTSAEGAGKSLNLLSHLFPKIDSLYYDSHLSISGKKSRTQEELNHVRSIASDYYFNRYFYYAVQDGEIPERTFDVFQQAMINGQVADACQKAGVIIDLSSDDKFFRRLEDRVLLHQTKQTNQLAFWETIALTPEEAERYCELLICLSSKLSYTVVGDRSLRLLSRSSGLLLSYLILAPEEKIIAIGERIIKNSSNTELPLELMVDLHNVRRRNNADNPEMKQVRELFTNERYQPLARALVDRIVVETAELGKPWYELYPLKTQHLLVIWQAAHGKEKLTASLKEVFVNKPDELGVFLRNASPIANTGTNQVFIRLDEGAYELYNSTLDTDYLYNLSKSLVGQEEPIRYNSDVFTVPSERERIHQFIYLHNKAIEDEQEKVLHALRIEMASDDPDIPEDFDEGPDL